MGWGNWIFTCKRMKLDLYQTPYTQINSKLNKDLNIRSETTKLLEENTSYKHLDIVTGNVCFLI